MNNDKVDNFATLAALYALGHLEGEEHTAFEALLRERQGPAADRLDGFRQVVTAEFPGIEIIGPIEGHDEHAETAAQVSVLLARHPDLAGLYNLGAGNAGLVSALTASGRAGAIRVIAHELSAPTRQGLLSGVIDVAIDQNPDGEIRAAIAAARSLALGGSSAVPADPIEIGIFLRDNLR